MLLHTKLQVRAGIPASPPATAGLSTARVPGQNPSASAWEHATSGVSLGCHDTADATAETSSGKPLAVLVAREGCCYHRAVCSFQKFRLSLMSFTFWKS